MALTVAQLPAHSHTLQASSTEGDKSGPDGKILADSRGTGLTKGYADPINKVNLKAGSISNTVDGHDHENMQPTLVVRCIICMQGLFPSRN